MKETDVVIIEENGMTFCDSLGDALDLSETLRSPHDILKRNAANGLWRLEDSFLALPKLEIRK